MSEPENNLLTLFGERTLRDLGVPFDKVVRVDFTVEGDRCYSEYTPGWSEYPVLVRYVYKGEDKRTWKNYAGLYEIIRILEEIDDAIRDSW